jgi:hypothetical protein
MDYEHDVAPSSAYVDIVTQNNCSFVDAFQFDPPVNGITDSTWNLTGQNFRLDVKANKLQTAPLLSLTSAAGQIIVDDAVNRILHFNVPESVISAALIPGRYVYDFIMFDGSTPPVRVPLMHGEFVVREGITGG